MLEEQGGVARSAVGIPVGLSVAVIRYFRFRPHCPEKAACLKSRASVGVRTVGV
jgi:hypothetical protein